jgi:hypothetical protein
LEDRRLLTRAVETRILGRRGGHVPAPGPAASVVVDLGILVTIVVDAAPATPDRCRS